MKALVVLIAVLALFAVLGAHGQGHKEYLSHVFDIKCDVCQLAMNGVKAAVDAGATDIKKVLSQECEKLEIGGDLCKSKLVEYVDGLVVDSASTSAFLCHQIRWCAPRNAYFDVKPTVVSDAVPSKSPRAALADLKCSSCLGLFTFLYNNLGTSLNSTELSKKLENVCSNVPFLLQGVCKQVIATNIPRIVEIFDKKNPKSMCVALNFCSEAAKRDVITDYDEDYEDEDFQFDMDIDAGDDFGVYYDEDEDAEFDSDDFDFDFDLDEDFDIDFDFEDDDEDFDFDLDFDLVGYDEDFETDFDDDDDFDFDYDLEDDDYEADEDYDDDEYDFDDEVDELVRVLEDLEIASDLDIDFNVEADGVVGAVLKRDLTEEDEEDDDDDELDDDDEDEDYDELDENTNVDESENELDDPRVFYFGIEGKMNKRSATAIEISGANAQCQICQWAVSAIEAYISQPDTEQQFARVLQELCTVLPGNYATICQNFVVVYMDEAVNYIIDNLTPPVVCSKIDVCPPPTQSPTPTA